MRSISGDPEKTRVSVLAEKPVFRRHMKSRAEGAARDLEGGELIKTVLDAGVFQPLHAEYTMQMCPNRVISVNELQHFLGKTAYNRKILAKIE